MPTSSGISGVGTQTLLDGGAYTGLSFEIALAVPAPLSFQRVGYAYLFAVQNVKPNQVILIDRKPIYIPGIYLLMYSGYPSTDYTATIIATWDVEDLSWLVRYT